MDEITLKANKRTIIGKQVSALRRAGILPAIIYGTGIEPVPLELNAHEASRILKEVSGSTLLTLQIGSQKHAAIVRDVQIDVLRRELIHIDFLKVALDSVIRTTVPVSTTGEAPAVIDLGGVLVLGLSQLEIEAMPGDLPDTIIVDLSPLTEINSSITVKDIFAGKDVTVLSDENEILARVVAQAIEEEIEEEVVEEDLVEALDEPDVLEKGLREEEGETKEEEEKT